MTALLALTLGLTGCGRSAQAPAAPPPPPGGEAAVFSADDGTTTQYWLADPAKPSVRRLLGSVAHEPGWPGNAAVSPDGRTLAYTMLPTGSRDPDHDAELMTLTLAGGRAEAVAHGIDLRSTLVWSDSSTAISFQSYEGTTELLWLQPADGGAGKVLAQAISGQRLLPIAADSDGSRVLAAQYAASGVDLVSVATGSPVTPVAHLTNGVARNFVLNETGTAIAFVASEAEAGDELSRGYVMQIAGSAEQTLPASWGEVVGVAWNPSGVLVAGSTGQQAGLYTLSGGRLQMPAMPGFAQPLAWSPSGRYLAVRIFSGSSGEQPGNAREAILSADGSLAMITDSAPVRFIGWIAQVGQHAAR